MNIFRTIVISLETSHIHSYNEQMFLNMMRLFDANLPIISFAIFIITMKVTLGLRFWRNLFGFFYTRDLGDILKFIVESQPPYHILTLDIHISFQIHNLVP